MFFALMPLLSVFIVALVVAVLAGIFRQYAPLPAPFKGVLFTLIVLGWLIFLLVQLWPRLTHLGG